MKYQTYSSKMKADRADVSHWLIDASLKKRSLEADRKWLNGDAVAVIIAGRYGICLQ
jgi:hypothetical protein